MQIIALLSLLPFLAPSLALPGHDLNLAQREYRQAHHRQAARLVSEEGMARRSRRNGTCRHRHSSAAASGSIPAVGYAAQPSASPAASQYGSQISSAGTTAAPKASGASGDDSLAQWSSAAVSASAAAAGSAAPVALVAVASSKASAAASSATSSAAAAASSAASNSTSTSGGASVAGKPALTPGGKKAGITLCDGISAFVGHISWCYDWSPSPNAPSGVTGVSMLWGDGSLGADQQDASRLAAFKALTTSPAYILGPEEPDCSTPGSAAMSVDATATLWNNVIAPHGAQGSLLMSPSMCHQADETFLTPFEAKISTPWDVTNLHINKIDMAGVKKDLDYYWNTYKKPMWVSEFACVEDQSWTPCTDQSKINSFISDIVDLFESDSRVYAYAYSNGIGLGDAWPAITNGQLTASGKAYLAAVSKYH